MDTAALLDLTRSILAQPTAPFHEDAVRAEILIQLAQIRSVHVEQDDFGNVIARYEGCSGHAEYAFAAHMDHPGYVFKTTERTEGTENGVATSSSSTSVPSVSSVVEKDSGWEFLGGVPEAYRAKNPPTRDFGAFAMWDLPACEVNEGRIYSRACDDLIGCVAILALFQELDRTEAMPTVYGLFTRAEEVGFIGAIHLAKTGRVPKDVTIVSLECSSERSPGAGKMGEGPIIRVGDKTSIFDDAATAALVKAATDAKLPHQRCLMSGGTCEATAYQLYGYRTAALCVALGHYHNCGPDETIAAEFVAVNDIRGMIQLMHAAATNESPTDPHAVLREKLEKGLENYRRFF
jgi:endoglucanase